MVSSDLSHFLGYEAAVRRDRATAAAIERLDGDRLGPKDACGYRPIRGWLALARQHGMSVERLDLRNSGDTASGTGGAWSATALGRSATQVHKETSRRRHKRLPVRFRR